MKESFMDKGGKNPGPPEGAERPPSPPGQNAISRKVQALEKTKQLLIQLREAASNWAKRWNTHGHETVKGNVVDDECGICKNKLVLGKLIKFSRLGKKGD